MTKAAWRIASLLLLCVPALAGCGHRAGPPPLAGAAMGGPFTLIDAHGRAVTAHSFAGRYRTMYFGYTSCPDVCPTDLAQLMQGYHAFAKRHPNRAARLVPIFVSVDPGRDTPAVMRRYTEAFGPELVGLTGTPAQVAAAARAYRAYFKIVPQPGGTYLVDHSRQTVLYGPDGQPITLVPAGQGADAVEQAFEQWVR